MGTGDKAASAGSQRVGASFRPHQQKILQACKQSADQYIENLSKQVFDTLDDTLISRGNKDGEGPESLDYMVAQQELAAKRSEILTAFREGASQNFNARLRSIGSAVSLSKKGSGLAGGLSLVDEKELEESLAVDGLVARARDRMRNELYALAKRFNALIDGANYDEESLPLDPEIFAHAFRDIIQKLDLKVEIKLITYKLFEQGVMQTLGQFYNQINSQLSNAGVLPELKISMPMRSVGGAAQSHHKERKAQEQTGETSQPSSHGSESKESHSTASPPADVFQTLQKLMNARKYGDVSPGGGALDDVVDGGNGWDGLSGNNSVATSGPPLASEDLVQGLSLLQHGALPVTAGGAINISIIKDALLGQMRQSGEERRIDPSHDNTIDVIGMIFEFILDEPSIPDVVKGLLNQLQIPILKIALVDKEFFTNKNHPARRLLNVLGHASIGWNDNDEASRQRRFQKMETIVNRVLAEFEQDPGIFRTLLDEFIEFIAQDGAEIVAEPEPVETEQEQEVQPERLAFETIEARLEGVEVPEVLREFLRNIWRDVLQHVLDQDGYDSDAWQRHEQLVEDLMWSVEPKVTSDDRRKMVMLLPRLLNALREGLTQIGCDQEQIDALIDAFEPIHMACLHGEKHETIESKQDVHAASKTEIQLEDQSNAPEIIQEKVPEITESTTEDKSVSTLGNEISDFERELLGMDVTTLEEEVDHSEQETELEIDDEFTVMAADMGLGTWLEFNIEEKKRRGKLAWKSVVMGEYVFVDRKYKVVAERTLATLAADLRSGSAALVQDVPMFDRALDKVLNGLMGGGSQASH